MLAHPYEYALLRLVPDLERGECLNIAVIVFCARADFLASRGELDPARFAPLAPGLDVSTVQSHLDAMSSICRGESCGGPIASFPIRERFHWLVHPRSTILQTSAVHAGVCDDLDTTLDALFTRLVKRPHG